MSFLDESEDRPRPPAPRRPGASGGDRQAMRTRRGIALAAAVLITVLLVLAVRGCLNAREERAFEDYVQEVGSLVTESDQQSRAFFELLGGTEGQSSVDVQNTVNGFQVEAERLVDRARATDHPEQMNTAHDYLVESLEFRSDGLSGVADRLPTALADEGRGEAVGQIAAQMQNFLTSDVIYSQRVIPNLEGPLKSQNLAAEVGDIPQSRFLPDIDWLKPDVVATRVAELRGGETSADEPATPGLHGTGLEGVTVQPSGDELVEGTAVEVAAGGDLSFEVEIANQGDNDETDIPVRVSLEGGATPIELETDLDSVDAGETATATVPLTETPPSGEELEVTVTVEPVPGEESSDNNEATYLVTFTE